MAKSKTTIGCAGCLGVVVAGLLLFCIVSAVFMPGTEQVVGPQLASQEPKEAGDKGNANPVPRVPADEERQVPKTERREPDDSADQQRAAAAAEKSRLEADAVTTSKDYVTKFLRYPLDADFPWFDYEVRSNASNSVFWVISTVKAQNAFGATLTLPWKTNLLLKNNTWSLAYCEIDGEVVYMDEATQDAVEELAAILSGTGAPADPEAAAAAEKAAQKEQRLAEAARRREAAEKNRPTIAANTLKIAKQFAESGDTDLAEKWYQKVVDQYPETDAAATARELLGTKDGDRVAEMRTWTDDAGTHTVEAQFLNLRDGKVRLKKTNGQVITLALEDLSEADQQYIQQMESE